MLDRPAFVRPIAHRGLHDASAGRIENSAPAFEAAIARGFGIECDLRPGADGLPLVFHDETLDRVTRHSGPVSKLTASDAAAIRYPTCGTPLLTFDALLQLAAGRVPLLVEIKSEWDAPDAAFLGEIARLSAGYRGPLALMSFDPAVMAAIRTLAPDVPRGIVSGLYEGEDGDTWWSHRLSRERAYALAHLLECGPVAPDFIAYHVKALPTPVTRFVREVLGLPMFTWTVRDANDLAIQRAWADAAIFEGAIVDQIASRR